MIIYRRRQRPRPSSTSHIIGPDVSRSAESSKERRRRWSPEQKLAMVRESLEPGQSVSVVARRNGINANQLFLWRKLYQDGSLSAVSAGEAVERRAQADP